VRAALAVVGVRFLVLPLLGCVIVVGSIKLGWYDPPNPVFVFLLLLQVRVGWAAGKAGVTWQRARPKTGRLAPTPHACARMCAAPPPPHTHTPRTPPPRPTSAAVLGPHQQPDTEHGVNVPEPREGDRCAFIPCTRALSSPR
jgi:hypothetical protein